MKHRVISLMLAAAFAAAGVAVRAQSGDPSLVWTAPVKVTRPAPKPNRRPAKPRPKKVVETVPLLSLRWTVLKRDAQLNPQQSNPDALFQIGDRLQLRFTVNQSGYLYIVKNSDEDEQPLLFPDSRINDGKNFVEKDKPITIPSNCPADFSDAKGNCWFRVTDEPDELTVIFSRDLITDLPEKIKEADKARVKKQGLLDIKRGSGQKLSKANFDPYTIQITNTNRADNEELVTTIVINHAKAEND
jgi:hypothetical protein